MNVSEIARVQQYLRDKFSNNRIKLLKRPDADDSVEVAIDDEFIGVIYRDDDEGEVSFAFHMAIIELDLPRL